MVVPLVGLLVDLMVAMWVVQMVAQMGTNLAVQKETLMVVRRVALMEWC